MVRAIRTLLVVSLAVSGAVIAAPADARPIRVALAPIENDSAGVGKAVAGALEDSELELVAGKAVTRTIDRLGLDAELAARDAARLAEELEVDAVVHGALERGGNRLRFTIFSRGKAGKPVHVATGKASPERFRKVVRTALLERIVAAARARSREADPAEGEAKPGRKRAARDDAEADARPASKRAASKDDAADGDVKPGRKRAARDDAEEPDAKASKRVASRDDAEADARPASKRAASKDDAADGDVKPGRKRAARDDAEEPEAKPGRKRVASRDDAEDAEPTREREPGLTDVRDRGRVAQAANLAAVRLDVGGSMAGRSLRFATREFAEAPDDYRNAPAPGARVSGEMYPYAFVDPASWLAGLGVAGSYGKTLSLTLPAPQGTTAARAITEEQYALGVRYRIAFGHQPTSPTLTLGAGYSARRFAVDRSGLMAGDSIDLPDVDYRMVDPGFAFRLPLGSRFAVSLAGQAFLLTSAGPIQNTDQYGQAKAIGGAASAAVEVVIMDHVALRLAAEATQVNLEFTGDGTLANNRDGDAATVDVRSATDRSYGGVATLALTY